MATEYKTDIVNYYNNNLWEDSILLNLMAIYKRHIDDFNNQGWKKRNDFKDSVSYEAFIKGIEMTIRTYIFDIMEREFGNNSRMYDNESIKESIFKKN